MFRMVQKVIYLRSLLNLSAANSDLSLAHIGHNYNLNPVKLLMSHVN